MITFQTNQKITTKDLISLYDSVGWTLYTKEPEKLQQAVSNALAVICAWEHGQLIGLIRCVGDDTTILYIQDILVLPAYQNQKIGQQLMERVLARFAHVRQIVLLTEDAPDVRHFYETCGFTSADQGQTVAFYQFR